MNTHTPLKVVLIKPSKYSQDGFVERFRWGFMPNSTLRHILSMTVEYARQAGVQFEVQAIDEYIEGGRDYLNRLARADSRTLVALVGVQSHQFQRALDLAALARNGGAQVIIGGPHVMTCDTGLFHESGVSFALAEAELLWTSILNDALQGELKPVYGQEQRWQQELNSPVIIPPDRDELRRYLVPMLGIYPARGCPFTCNFCSVIKIAGRRVRAQTIDATLESLERAKHAGVRFVMFTSDNFNKIPAVRELLQGIVEADLGLRFFVQCDTQIASRDQDLIPLLAEAGCYEIFVGVESFSRKVLLKAKKFQNHPEHYAEIVRLCRKHRIATHVSNIIGFPGETEQDILQHLEILRGLHPTNSSFYILTPIPGTDQYDDFQGKGLLSETNLDRFDGTCETWRHDVLDPGRLHELLYYCYRKFYSLRDLIKKNYLGCYVKDDHFGIGGTLFARFSAWRRMHPMSGGVGRLRLDHVREYLDLRRRTYGISLAPLPASLQLSAADAALNRQVSLA